MQRVRSDGQLPCSVDALRHVADITLAAATWPGHAIAPERANHVPLVGVVLEGALTERMGHRTTSLEAGTLFVYPRQEPYAHRFDAAGARFFVVQLDEAWIGRMRALGIPEPGRPEHLRESRANALAAQLHAEFAAGDDGSRLLIEDYAVALLGELSKSGGQRERMSRPPWIARAIERLHASAAGEVDMAAIAAEVGVHPVHLSRTFRAQHGTTMGDYLRRLRVERARAQLLATAKPLSQIALEAGFADQAHFTRVFRKHVGATPGEVRRVAGSAAALAG